MAKQDFNLASLDGSNGFQLNGENKYDLFGGSVSNAGDVNGDGFDDVIIGARGADPHGDFSGSSYVLFGKASGFDAHIDLSSLNGSDGFRLDGENEFDSSGVSVSAAGDVNGDGFDDVIIGATGTRYLVFGRASGFAAHIDLSNLNGSNGFRLDGVVVGNSFSKAISSAGDMNGDGFDDLIVGAGSFSCVLFGKDGEFDANINLSDLDGSNGFRLEGSSGRSVSSAGDVNGDGFDDVIIGSTVRSSFVLLGKADGFAASINLSSLDGHDGFRLNGERALDDFGHSVSTAGDINGDGFDDVIVGAPFAAKNGDFSGSSYVIFGKASGFDAQMDVSSLDGSNGFRLDGENEFDSSGVSVSAAGDVNGDGIDDLVIGAWQAGNYHVDSGVSYVVFGRTSGFEAQLDLSSLDGRNGIRLDGEHGFDSSGATVSTAGDVNGDGFDDMIIGAPDAGPHDDLSGSGYVIFGGPDVTGNLALPDINGMIANDHLQGTPVAEYLSAGAGDDTLIGGGGADKFDGGDGDDVISVTDLGFAAIDGGAGEDTLQLSGSNIHLDLTQRADQLHHIETIDLQGDGDNDLTLTVDTLPTFHESFSTANSLTIRGNSGDRVNVLDTDWSDAGIVNGYHTYVNPEGSLRVQQDVQVDFVHRIRALFNTANLDGSNGFRLIGENIYDSAGESVSNAGDVNGDGFDDVIVGAPGAQSSYVVFGKAVGFDADINLSSLNGDDGFRLHGSNFSVSSAGDMNGDGFDDVIVDAGSSSCVVFGKAAGFDADINLSDLGGIDGFRLNGSGDSVSPVSSAGDINGDGLSDVIIGAGNSSYVVFGKTLRFDAQMDLTGLDGSDGFSLNGSGSLFSRVSNAGDVNGDGFDDVIIGAAGASPNGEFSGSSYIVFGKASGFDAHMNLSDLDGSNGFRLDGANEQDRSGSSVSSAGDVNGDGFGDVIIGAPLANSNASASGSSYIVFGKASGFDAQFDLSNLDGNNGFQLNGARETDESGWSVSGAGDTNGDGFDDLIVGSHSDYYVSDSYVVFGKASGFDAQIDLSAMLSDDGFRLISDHPTVFGSSVSGAGDINGDGLDDLIVGAPEGTFRSYYYTAGKSYVIFGSRDFGGGGSGELPEITGTANADTLKGTTAAEHFIAGDGKDNLLGLGGADIFDAGAGDDAIRIGDLTFASIDGGEGNDALHLAGSDMNLDLSVLGDQIHSIETICLYGRGDNTLTLNTETLLSLSDSTNTLKVHGNTGDHIVMQDDGWVDGGNRGFYHTYTHDDAVLLVGANVAVELV